jgi:outer membrane protein assembly factor BamB
VPFSVTTRSYTNARTGANIHETVLTPALVRTRGIKRLFTLKLDDARGTEGAPLIVAGAGPFADGSHHDAVYICTMNNSVWAFDANTGAKLWPAPVALGPPVKNIPRGMPKAGNIDSKFINDHWGILSTPVIDTESNTLYAITWSSEANTAQQSLLQSVHHLHALDITNGSARHPAIKLDGIIDEDSGFRFISPAQKQRAALLLERVKDGAGNMHKTLFMVCGSVAETSRRAHGWVLAFDLEKFALAATYVTTRNTHGAGIWHAARGPCADNNGNLYCMTGNGGWDGVKDFAESFIRLTYKPAEGNQKATLEIGDWFTPFLDNSIKGPDHHTVAQGRNPETTNNRGYDWTDQDLGSGGPVFLEDLGLIIGAGKDGILYVLDKNKFGKTQLSDLENPANNYAKLKAPPTFFTFNGIGIDPAPNDPRTLNHYFLDNKTHHLHGSPVYWNSPRHGHLLFCWGENESLRAWKIVPNGVATFLAKGAEIASLGAAGSDGHGGMPGGMLTVSSNGSVPATGVVWSLAPLNGDANSQVTPGVLRAYDAEEFDTNPDGSLAFRLLWHSDQWNINFSHNKFNVPVVANGKIYVPTYDGTVDVYGLA